MRNVEVVHESSYDGGFGVEVVRSLRIQKLHFGILIQVSRLGQSAVPAVLVFRRRRDRYGISNN